jgi:disulfide bond formation protein DsbB
VDLLAGVSGEGLRLLPWVPAIGFALVAAVLRPRRIHLVALGTVLLFAALSAGAGVYVLNHVGDARWSAGEESRLSAPSFSGTPLVGQFLVPLDSVLNQVVGGVNEFLALQQALPVALDFFAAAGWALLVSFPLAIVAVAVSYAEARRRRAEFEDYRAAVDLLKGEVETLKWQIASGNSVDTAPRTEDD